MLGENFAHGDKMAGLDWALIATIITLSIVATGTIIYLISLADRSGTVSTEQPNTFETDISFLFIGDQLHHASPDALHLMEQFSPDSSEWADIADVLGQRFGAVPMNMPTNDLELAALHPQDHATLQIAVQGANFTCTVKDASNGSSDRHAYFSTLLEKEHLAQIAEHTSGPIWRCDANDTVTWHNTAYQLLAQIADTGDNPDASIFDIPKGEKSKLSHRARVSVSTQNSPKDIWYDVSSKSVPSGTLHYATNINAVVEAEAAQREFVQTLAKTFAHLPIGLAIFDRNQKLVLFNPAMLDLTALSAEFLSARPNLFSFFDQLREKHIMPEPKNYGTWRDAMAELIAAAQDDRYAETWTLASGVTYQVTGRPHPDGAIAFLIEDISAEISLTRRFRSELELAHSAFDKIDNAFAIFSPSGLLTFSNVAYREMWNTDPDGGFGDHTVLDATKHWQSVCQPNPVWSEIREFVLTLHERASFESTVSRLNGQFLTCYCDPLAGGATLVRFAETRKRKALAIPPRVSETLEHKASL